MPLRFGDCELDLETRELRRAGRPIHLTPKAYALLALLANERPRPVARERILEEVWPATFVTDASVAVAIAEVRRALGDSGAEERFVRTVRQFGYAFCADAVPEPAAESPPGALCRLVAWGIEQRWLAAGEHFVGRGDECAVRIDSASLSRRHARLVIGRHEATLEDLGSKNGSYVNGERLSSGSPRPVAEGDELRLGSVVFSLHWLAVGGPTETLAPTDRPGSRV